LVDHLRMANQQLEPAGTSPERGNSGISRIKDRLKDKEIDEKKPTIMLVICKACYENKDIELVKAVQYCTNGKLNNFESHLQTMDGRNVPGHGEIKAATVQKAES
jgi:hypothetical protein